MLSITVTEDFFLIKIERTHLRNIFLKLTGSKFDNGQLGISIELIIKSFYEVWCKEKYHKKLI